MSSSVAFSSVSKSPDDYDGTIKIGHHIIYVHRKHLASHSPVFKTLFFGDFAEKDKEEVEIKNVVYGEFLDLLHVLNHLQPVYWNNDTHILKLADLFKIKVVKERCNDYLRSPQCTVPLITRIELANKYKLHSIVRFSIGEMSKEELNELRHSTHYSNLTTEQVNLLFGRLLTQ